MRRAAPTSSNTRWLAAPLTPAMSTAAETVALVSIVHPAVTSRRGTPVRSAVPMRPSAGQMPPGTNFAVWASRKAAAPTRLGTSPWSIRWRVAGQAKA